MNQSSSSARLNSFCNKMHSQKNKTTLCCSEWSYFTIQFIIIHVVALSSKGVKQQRTWRNIENVKDNVQQIKVIKSTLCCLNNFTISHDIQKKKTLACDKSVCTIAERQHNIVVEMRRNVLAFLMSCNCEIIVELVIKREREGKSQESF